MNGPTEPVDNPPPRAMILSYLTNTGTPTRVRRIAAIGMIGSALTYAAVGLYSTSILLWDVAGDLLDIFSPRYLLTHFSVVLRVDPIDPFLIAIFFPMAIIQIALASQVRRGRKLSCWIGLVTLSPLFAYCGITSILLAGYACLNGFTVHGIPGRPAAFLWLIPVMLLLVAALLVRDVMMLLAWIARAPTIEKPPVPFLPVTRHAKEPVWKNG